MIKVTGKIPIQTDVPTEESLQDFVERAFEDFVNVSDGVVYVSGYVEEDDLDLLEEFFIKIWPVIDFSEAIRVKIKGESAESVGEYLITDEGIILYRFNGIKEVEPKEIYVP